MGLLRPPVLPRLHARVPVRALGARLPRPGARRAGRPDQASGHPGRPGRGMAHLVDGPRARRQPAAGAHRGGLRPLRAHHLVRQRRLGSGRLRRPRLRAAVAPGDLARPAGAGRRLGRHRGAHQAAAGDHHPDRRGSRHPAGAPRATPDELGSIRSPQPTGDPPRWAYRPAEPAPRRGGRWSASVAGRGASVARSGSSPRPSSGLVTAVVLSAPFGLTIFGLARAGPRAAGGYPYLTVNAYNPWALVPDEAAGASLPRGIWLCDARIDLARCPEPILIGPVWALSSAAP